MTKNAIEKSVETSRDEVSPNSSVLSELTDDFEFSLEYGSLDLASAIALLGVCNLFLGRIQNTPNFRFSNIFQLDDMIIEFRGLH